jgi:hypothetical protein
VKGRLISFASPLPSLLFIGLSALSLRAQQAAPAVIYAESFRQGTTHIVEDHFEAKLTPQDSTYRERIKDAHGTDRYAFSMEPVGPLGDTKITSWQAKLADLQHKFYDNVLLTSQTPSDNPDDPRDAVANLYPSKFAKVPSVAKRIIKVDGFYVVLQVKSFHFTPADSPYLDSMTVAVTFTNTDPRSADDVPK